MTLKSMQLPSIASTLDYHQNYAFESQVKIKSNIHLNKFSSFLRSLIIASRMSKYCKVVLNELE
jgi:hypothetical protein